MPLRSRGIFFMLFDQIINPNRYEKDGLINFSTYYNFLNEQ